MILAIFDLQVTPRILINCQVNEPFIEEFKIDFPDGGRLEFPIETILAIFDLQVTLMLPTEF